jgi:stage III sporulation protein SpoIIIAA
LSNTATAGAERSHEMTSKQQRVTDNLAQLLEVLPPIIRLHLEKANNLDDLLEIVLDLGRVPEARYPDRVIELGDVGVTSSTL